MNKGDCVQVFYACDDAFVKYLAVSLRSMIDNSDEDRCYSVHVLYSTLSCEMADMLRGMIPKNFTISFDNVEKSLERVKKELPIRDYYSKTTYYRFFIPDMFPEIKRAIYIDTDTVLLADIGRLYDTELEGRAVGAAHEQVMVQTDVFGRYAEQVIGIDRRAFFNAGVMLIDCDEFRRWRVSEKFIHYLGVYDFRVTQDEDYLNLILKDRVFWLDQRWNSELACRLDYEPRDAYLLHYIMTNKPWHYEKVPGADIFWEVAKRTPVYEVLKKQLDEYTEEEKVRDKKVGESLMALAESEIAREDNFLKVRRREKLDPDRVRIEEKIAEYERAGRFAEDVEDDPPSRVLKEGEVDFLKKKLSSRIKQAYATKLAGAFLKKIIKDGQLRVKDIRGTENFRDLSTGAIVTCNHFNAFDSFAMHLAYAASGHKKRKLYRVIREGNYTSFPGFYGKLMRNFYTLPLSSNHRVMKEFLGAVDSLLKEGHFILIYPEQSMWWNYRKPKPLQGGAFSIAARSGCPVLPIFITMQDSDTVGEDGYYIQEYTIHIDKPIYPDPDRSYKENAEFMTQENARVWREIYEREYGMPVVYG